MTETIPDDVITGAVEAVLEEEHRNLIAKKAISDATAALYTQEWPGNEMSDLHDLVRAIQAQVSTYTHLKQNAFLNFKIKFYAETENQREKILSSKQQLYRLVARIRRKSKGIISEEHWKAYRQKLYDDVGRYSITPVSVRF